MRLLTRQELEERRKAYSLPVDNDWVPKVGDIVYLPPNDTEQVSSWYISGRVISVMGRWVCVKCERGEKGRYMANELRLRTEGIPQCSV